jgi:hypothetical protein
MARGLDQARDSFSSGLRRYCENLPVILFLICIAVFKIINSEACQQLQAEPSVPLCGNGIHYAYYMCVCVCVRFFFVY